MELRMKEAKSSVLMTTSEQRIDSNLYSARNMAKPVNFYCDAPHAHLVHLEGDFSGWAPRAMQKRVDGWWFLEVQLTLGTINTDSGLMATRSWILTRAVSHTMRPMKRSRSSWSTELNV